MAFNSALGCDGAGELATRRTARVAGNKALVIDFSLLTAMDAASRRFLSRYHAGETVCEQTSSSPESIADIPVASHTAVCEPCRVWISLGAGQKR
jgi:hypothetical protein